MTKSTLSEKLMRGINILISIHSTKFIVENTLQIESSILVSRQSTNLVCTETFWGHTILSLNRNIYCD